ncbi:MAG: hypothetical protein M1816_001359 [Peltula sp. TS41687]|nr:MAG: hypothetical protein M1816_001359 [Peltula sp. TS41687]
MSSPENKSYLPAGLASFSPWSSRPSTPKPVAGAESDKHGQQRGGDHTVSHRHRFFMREYPSDCPPLQVRWFYAVDVAKRKPNSVAQASKPPPVPKKYVPFSAKDSRAMETAYQKLVSEEDAMETRRSSQKATETPHAKPDGNTNLAGSVKVPCNEDYLFEVSLKERELAPAYWLGPVYKVIRGSWFTVEGSNLRPCDETLATQLEEGYLKIKPFRYANQRRASSQPRPSSSTDPVNAALMQKAGESIGQYPSDDLEVQLKGDRTDARTVVKEASRSSPQPQPQTHRLFGPYMNQTVTYEDGKTAWIVTDDFLSRMSSTVYQRFGGGYRGGLKVVRGYSEPKKTKEVKSDGEKKGDAMVSGSAETEPGSGKQDSPHGERRLSGPDRDTSQLPASPAVNAESTTRMQTIERQISDLAASTRIKDPDQQEEEARRREEKAMEDDYRDDEGVDQDREIEHLILVSHGIGQRLGMRMESVNFVLDVATLRSTLKSVYASSADLQALNNEALEKLPKNSRVQVLPVCWRHLLDFPKQRVQPNQKEQDLGDMTSLDAEENYPSLQDITLEGVPAVRSLISDLALDILLYQSAYKEHIIAIVRQECNRIFKLFSEKNPNFKGHVSLLGHSLGSAIMFDILCDQRDRPRSGVATSERRSSHDKASSKEGEEAGLDLDFEVDSFFCIGSPIGLFQMLNGRTIAARQSSPPSPSSSDIGLAQKSSLADPVSISNAAADKNSSRDHLSATVSSPKCARLYNIFHPTDPISYRIEPLISPAMASLPPQALPYTKKGIFGAPVSQGLSGIGARVGQSVSGLWTSFSSGIATSILNRSLGISGEDILKTPAQNVGQLGGRPSSIGAGTNISGGDVIATTPTTRAVQAVDRGDDKKRKLESDMSTSDLAGERPPTLIDGELETLYSGFQKRRKSHQSGGGQDLGETAEWQALEETARRIKNQELKVRALNPNGRVDYSIQEGVFDISLIASIASHLQYWSEPDLAHFIISQLLSSHRVLARRDKGKDLTPDTVPKQV